MQTRLLNLWEKLRSSFWPIPGAIVLLAACLFVLMMALDRIYALDSFLFLEFLGPLSAGGARIVLSTIAGSMITVAGTVFSITIVTLTLASHQFGPRLIRNFMRSLTNQVVLGSFIATFVYCLFVLGVVEPQGDDNFTPGLAVNFAVLLAVFNVGILIFFIHHVAVSIQADQVIQNVNSELLLHIEDYFPERLESGHNPLRQQFTLAADTVAPSRSGCLVANAHGYLQAIDYATLKDLTQQHKMCLTVLRKPGVYIMQGLALAEVSCRHSIDDKTREQLQNTFLLGAERTSEQDVEYAIHQLVEIAVRSLSAGINDPFTAISCINCLGSAICQIQARKFPAGIVLGDTGQELIRFETTSYPGIVQAAFDQIRQHGNGNAAILIRLLEVLRDLLEQTAVAAQKETLLLHAAMIHRAGLASLPEIMDRKDLEDRYQFIVSENVRI